MTEGHPPSNSFIKKNEPNETPDNRTTLAESQRSTVKPKLLPFPEKDLEDIKTVPALDWNNENKGSYFVSEGQMNLPSKDPLPSPNEAKKSKQINKLQPPIVFTEETTRRDKINRVNERIEPTEENELNRLLDVKEDLQLSPKPSAHIQHSTKNEVFDNSPLNDTIDQSNENQIQIVGPSQKETGKRYITDFRLQFILTIKYIF